MKLMMTAALCAAALISSPTVSAQSWPAKPVKIIVAYQPGQGTDVATRYLADQLTKAMGQSFFVDNHAGAGGNIGTQEAARATPDGYTLIMGTNGTHVLNQYLYPSLPFDPVKDFEPVILLSTFPMVVLANNAAPYKTVTDLMEAARRKPDAIDVALPSTTARLVLELLKQKGNTEVRGIPYKGSATSMNDVIGGQLGLAIDTVGASRAFISSGKLKALGVTSLKESALLPGVPTVASQGVPNFSVVAWNGLYAPKGTPRPIIEKLNSEIGKILANPDVRDRLLQLGHEPAGGSPEELGDFAKSERQTWGPLIAKAGIKAD